jgi:MFS transporter, FSR family, fosmidomycin resistance protein
MSAAPTAPATLTLPDARPRIWAGVVVHGVTDFFSYLLIPLMPLLITRLSLTPKQTAIILASGGLSSGLIQPLVAWLSDRWQTRWFGTLGLVFAVLAFTTFGFAHTFEQLLVLQIVGAAGVGAFHPVAAAAVGQLSGARRSFGVAVFFMGGMVGGVTGNLIAPPYAAAFGLKAMAWFMPFGMAAAVWLAWAIHSVSHNHHSAHADHAQLSAGERGARWFAVGLLYAGNVLRFGVNAALVHLMIEWTQRFVAAGADPGLSAQTLGNKASALNGPMQAAMQIGMGAAGISAGWLVRPGREKRALIVVPCFGAVAIAAIAGADHLLVGPLRGLVVPVVFVLTILAGIGFGGVLPVTISLSQRLLPHRTGLASGLMMGGAWAIGSGGPPAAEWLTRTLSLDGAIVIAGLALLVGGLLALALPAALVRKAA